MTVSELVSLLNGFNGNAKIQIQTDGNTPPATGFEIYFGSNEGVTKETCEDVTLAIGGISCERVSI
jgi:hypothetical protein